MNTDAFDRALEAVNLAGFWAARVPEHAPEPPFLWPWAPVREALLRASREIGIEAAERRVIKLVHPRLGGKSASRTIQFNFSIVNPGEVARAHRHSIAAVRFVVEGAGATTTVDGVRCAMEPGDLILTPAGTWHDHHNASAAPIIWLDGLDGPLVQALNSVFFEAFPEQRQPVREENTRFRIAFADSLARLADAPVDRHDGRVYRYPSATGETGTLPTMDCELSELAPGQRTANHRHTSLALYHVISGHGEIQVGDDRLEWAQGDTFTLPAWRWHSLTCRSATPARLFSMNDRTLLERLGLYREEASATA